MKSNFSLPATVYQGELYEHRHPFAPLRGVNVHPKEIEEVVIRRMDISEVAVIGVPDEK